MLSASQRHLFIAIFLLGAITGCGGGGGGAQYTVGGSVAGLTTLGLVLQDNAGDSLTVSGAGSFIFPTSLASGNTYNVTVQTQPSGQACSVTNGSGTIGSSNVTNVAINCTIASYTVGGTVAGLAGTGLTLANGTSTVSPTANGAFSFPDPVTTGAQYQVTVSSQPTFPSQNCTVSDGSGTVTNANITAVSVSCVTIPPSSTGSVLSLTAQADTSQGGGAITNNPFTFAVIHPDVHNYFFSVTYGGSAVNRINMSFDSITFNTSNPASATPNVIAPPIGGTTTGQMAGGSFVSVDSIYYNNAASQGAGTYSDIITIKVCYDAPCSQQVPGSPVTIPVTYTVTGNPISSATFGYFPPLVQLETASTTAAASTVTLNLTGSNMPSYGAYVFAKGGSGNLVTNTQFQQTSSPSVGSGGATLTASLSPGANVSPGIYSDTLQVSICFDAACNKPAVGSPWTVSLQYIIAATAGRDYDMKTLNIIASDVVWSPTAGKLFGLIPGYSSVNPNTITQIDPTSGTLDRSVSLGGVSVVPGTLAISDDGQYLYVGVLTSAVAYSVQRVVASSLTLDTTFALPSQQVIDAIGVAPGQPHTFAVGLSNPLPPSVVVYDDATQRAQGFSPANLFTWGADATHAFAFNANYPDTPTISSLSVSSSGLASAQSTGVTTVSTSPIGMLYLNPNVYLGDGTVFSTSNNTRQAPFVMTAGNGNASYSTGAIAVDGALDRAYFLTSLQPPGQSGGLYTTLESFKASDRSAQWLTHIPSQNETFVLTRWGTNGLALTTSGGSNTLVLISGAIVAR